MYKLYYSPGACSRAINALLRELGQEVQLIDRRQVADFATINPCEAVPVLVDETGFNLREGAAIVLHLLEKHPHPMFPPAGKQKSAWIEWLMFANATLHPAYSKLFFISASVTDPAARQQALSRAAEKISALWQVVETRLQASPDLTGQQPGIVEMMLTVYAAWGQGFPVEIELGPRVRELLANIEQHPSFIAAVASESVPVA